MESRWRLILIDNGFPIPETQVPVLDDAGEPFAYLDMGWRDIKVAVEYDGEQHRTDPLQYRKDQRRLPAIERRDWNVIRICAGDTTRDVLLRTYEMWLRRGGAEIDEMAWASRTFAPERTFGRDRGAAANPPGAKPLRGTALRPAACDRGRTPAVPVSWISTTAVVLHLEHVLGDRLADAVSGALVEVDFHPHGRLRSLDYECAGRRLTPWTKLLYSRSGSPNSTRLQPSQQLAEQVSQLGLGQLVAQAEVRPAAAEAQMRVG